MTMIKSDYPQKVCLVGSTDWQSKARLVLSPYCEVFGSDHPFLEPPEIYLVEKDHPRAQVEWVLQRLGPAPIKTCSNKDFDVIIQARKNPLYFLKLAQQPLGYAICMSSPQSKKAEHARALDRIIGTSLAITTLKSKILRYSQSDKPILILGETGVGKDLTAQVIHDLSPFADGPFIALNCATIPTGLAESELMGSVRGAFTNATDKVGLIKMADGGTLFLDEIGDLDLSVQTKLLRTLETGEYRRLGDTRMSHSRFRLIAATNKDPEKLIAAGQFREDFYFRIQTLTLRIPPLRDRTQDVVPIIQNLFPDHKFTASAWSWLLRNPWRGNVRELKAVIEKAAIEAEHGLIDWHHLAD